MKFRTQPQFDRDYKKLSISERSKFRQALSVFIAACKHFETHPTAFIWPAVLRFEKLVGAENVYAITWSFKQPDGRATFNLSHIDGEILVTWRRVGKHSIYKAP